MYVPHRVVKENPQAVPKLQRTTSLKSDGPRRRPERKSVGIFEESLENEKDFYDILAEKYGITNVKRYDLKPEETKKLSEKTKLTENRRSLISLAEMDQKDRGKTRLSNSEQDLNDLKEKSSNKNILPPLPPKPNLEKFKTPSEKLAAVLSKLESHHEKTEKKEVRGIPNDLLYGKKEKKKKEEKNLADLSPKALELYEKTLGLYHKKKDDEAKKFIEHSEKLLKNEGTKKMTRHKSDMSLKDFEKFEGPGKKSETPEKSVLSKYFHYSSLEDGISPEVKDKKLKHYGSLQLDEKKDDVEVAVTVKLPDKDKSPEKKKKLRRESSKEKDEETKKRERIKRLSKDLETELENELNKLEEKKEEKKKEEEKVAPNKNKFLSSLEKKFEKFRSSDKKYIDKAIRSLRESSLGPKDVASENVLIKRAVSMSDCSQPVAPSKIQSTVNSVLGIFKKFEGPDPNKKKTEEKLPAIKVEEGNQSRRFSNNSILEKSSMGFDDSSSFLSPDSESFDSWSNCSDFGTPDEFVPSLKSISPILKLANLDDVVSESVGDRIRRKSFYTRFNERKKPRKSAILEGRRKYDQEVYEEAKNHGEKRPQQPYLRSVSSMDYSKPKPFYKVGSKSPESPYRKTSLDWSKSASPTFVRSSSSGSNFSTNPSKSYFDSVRNRRMDSVYLERPFSPVRTFSPNRTLSPNFGFRRSPSTSALD